MKWIREILPRGKEAAFASGLLLLYAAALFLSPDPEWTMWAAQMAMGVLYVPDAPTLQGIAPGESVRVMSAAGSLGIFAAAALLALGIRTSCKARPAYRSLPWEETDAAAL
jgi:NADPH:quinone reductase-like Zn-dependent oxidoreductase